MNYKLLFFGSGDFAAIILKKLSPSAFKPTAVFTQPDKPIGRKQILSPSPAKKIAKDFGLNIFELESLKNEEAIKLIKSLTPDLIIVADYGKIIPKSILDIPKYGALNIHPSLLPRHRGATPIHYTILSGDPKTGVSIILMDEQVDHGPIIAAADYKSEMSEVGRIELTEKLAELGGESLIKILPQWLSGAIKPVPQDESGATYTKILTKEDGKIDWKKSAKEIDRQIRAFEGWPGTWTEWPVDEKKVKIKIIETEVSENDAPDAEGKVSVTKDGEMAITCGRGYLKILELQLEGKNKTTGKEFLRGYPEIIGATLI